MLQYKIIGDKTIEILVSDLEETAMVATKFAKVLRINDIIAMDGDLGAGKTTFTQNLCKALNVDEYVTSPTFTIMNVYEGDFEINHFDVYRISDVDEMYDIGFDQVLYNDNIVIIEWAQIIADILPEKLIKIGIKNGDKFSSRKIYISFFDDRIEDFEMHLRSCNR